MDRGEQDGRLAEPERSRTDPRQDRGEGAHGEERGGRVQPDRRDVVHRDAATRGGCQPGERADHRQRRPRHREQSRRRSGRCHERRRQQRRRDDAETNAPIGVTGERHDGTDHRDDEEGLDHRAPLSADRRASHVTSRTQAIVHGPITNASVGSP